MDSDNGWELTDAKPMSLDWIDKFFGHADCVILDPAHETHTLSEMNRHEGELYLSSIGYQRDGSGAWHGQGTTIMWSRYNSWVNVDYATSLLITVVKGLPPPKAQAATAAFVQSATTP